MTVMEVKWAVTVKFNLDRKKSEKHIQYSHYSKTFNEKSKNHCL